MNDKTQMVIENSMKNNTNLNNGGDPCRLAEKCQCILMDPQFTKISPEELFQKALQSETKEKTQLFFSMAAYLRRDYLPALFYRALGLFDI